jgi:hypothetical protein
MVSGHVGELNNLVNNFHILNNSAPNADPSAGGFAPLEPLYV